MGAKQLLFNTEARKKLKSGIDKLSDAVKKTLGPNGKYVVIQREYGSPLITNDGVAVAKEITLEDPTENIGASLIQQVSNKTDDDVGDGTTTATVIAQAIVEEGLKLAEAGRNSILIRSGLLKAKDEVIENLEKLSTPVNNDQAIKSIASISAKDPEIGDLIQKAIKKVGEAGMITIEEGNSYNTTVDIAEGMHFEEGFSSPYMMTNKSSMMAVHNSPKILVTDKKINNLQEILPILEQVVKEGNPLLIIASEFSEEVLTTLILNKMQGTFQITTVKAPSFGDDKIGQLEDIAIFTSAKFFSEKVNDSLKDAKMEDLGSADKVEVSKNRTIIIGGKETQKNTKARVDELKHLIDKSDSTYSKDQYRSRIAKMAGGIGVIRVGANTEVELKEKKMRIEDALKSTYAAIEEGIVVGGGVALMKASMNIQPNAESHEDVKIGYTILKEALKQPLKLIADNSGVSGEVVLNKIIEMKCTKGFNAVTGEYSDLEKDGVIDPLKVSKNALANAVSVASLILTTEVSVTEVSKTNDEPVMPPMGGMPGMM